MELRENKTYKTIHQPIIFSYAKEKRQQYPPPESGDHTSKILLGLGYSDDEIEALQLANVIF